MHYGAAGTGTAPRQGQHHSGRCVSSSPGLNKLPLQHDMEADIEQKKEAMAKR